MSIFVNSNLDEKLRTLNVLYVLSVLNCVCWLSFGLCKRDNECVFACRTQSDRLCMTVNGFVRTGIVVSSTKYNWLTL